MKVNLKSKTENIFQSFVSEVSIEGGMYLQLYKRSADRIIANVINQNV